MSISRKRDEQPLSDRAVEREKLKPQQLNLLIDDRPLSERLADRKIVKSVDRDRIPTEGLNDRNSSKSRSSTENVCVESQKKAKKNKCIETLTESLKNYDKSKPHKRDQTTIENSKDSEKSNLKSIKDCKKSKSHEQDKKITTNSNDCEKSKPHNRIETKTESLKNNKKSNLKNLRNCKKSESLKRDKKTADDSKDREKPKASKREESIKKSSKNQEKPDLKKSVNQRKSKSLELDKRTATNLKDCGKVKASKRDKTPMKISKDQEKSKLKSSRDRKKSASLDYDEKTAATSKNRENSKASKRDETTAKSAKDREKSELKNSGDCKKSVNQRDKKNATISKDCDKSKTHNRDHTPANSSRSRGKSPVENSGGHKTSESRDRSKTPTSSKMQLQRSKSPVSRECDISKKRALISQSRPWSRHQARHKALTRSRYSWSKSTTRQNLLASNYRHSSRGGCKPRFFVKPFNTFDTGEFQVKELNELMAFRRRHNWTPDRCEEQLEEVDYVLTNPPIFQNVPDGIVILKNWTLPGIASRGLKVRARRPAGYSSRSFYLTREEEELYWTDWGHEADNKRQLKPQDRKLSMPVQHFSSELYMPSHSTSSLVLEVPQSVSQPSQQNNRPSPPMPPPPPPTPPPLPPSPPPPPSPPSSAPSPPSPPSSAPSPPNWAPTTAYSHTSPNNLSLDEEKEPNLAISIDTDSDTDVEVVNIFNSSSRTDSQHVESYSTQYENSYPYFSNNESNMPDYNSYHPETKTSPVTYAGPDMHSHLDFLVNNPTSLYPHSTLPNRQEKPKESEKLFEINSNPYYLMNRSIFPKPMSISSNSETSTEEKQLNQNMNPVKSMYSSFMTTSPHSSNPNTNSAKPQTKQLENLDLEINPYASFMINNANSSNPTSNVSETNPSSQARQLVPDFNPQSSFLMYNPISFNSHNLHSTPLSKQPASITEHFTATPSPIAQQPPQWAHQFTNPFRPAVQPRETFLPSRPFTSRPLEPPSYRGPLPPYDSSLETTCRIDPYARQSDVILPVRSYNSRPLEPPSYRGTLPPYNPNLETTPRIYPNPVTSRNFDLDDQLNVWECSD